MKRLLIACMALGTLAVSCSKIDDPVTEIPGGETAVSLSLAADELQTLAFFDNTAKAEEWEKLLTSITVCCFDASDNLIVQRSFTPAEVAAKKASFAMPRSAAGTSVKFYVLANADAGKVSTLQELLALEETSAAVYNGTFAEVSSAAKRLGGFLMSGSVEKTVTAGQTTDVAVTLKRSVAKVAVQASLSSDFASKYPGKVKVNSTTVSRAAASSPYFAGGGKAPAATYTHKQTASEASSKYNNLFYLFGNDKRDAGSRVLLSLEGVYDMDGNFSTTNDQTPITYEVELEGTSANGTVSRNGYYRVAVVLTGLTGQDVNATITVADWETPVTQNINLGQ